MRAVVQRVLNANVEVNGKIVGDIKKGLLVFLGIGNDDNNKDLNYMVDKILGLRIFEDNNNKMNLSLLDIKGEILVVSQFTLYGDVRKGRRPSFTDSAKPDIAEKMYNQFINKCKQKGVKTEKGVFGADMKVKLVNDGPVTILIDSKKIF
ncbi:D-tyrosyl-tRNA(Tyr) deacylase [Keratinibaculum paraultunense]|uniref:D-aminoacyl-tRNA deacylase n=1 Tax=Keratinibaculum paraultunense TaxID=1278232 RepID=A0A4V2UU77_9FIRM|nr:D-aminoacyl-tRNA deacylase [Keratinibaculum paraultunense]QQY78755.1 D-tyrosyl-tRNA(Tyr) deacylase [Keratinibaculum paraultunense]TCS89565.1 D-tyrosyl-tRNA(Tyr) deacylase [Keratinibaculum paraultunense]